jgi:hypothetical protein
MILPYKDGVPVRLVSLYGVRVDPITYMQSWHAGIDLVSDSDKSVCAAVPGVVAVSTMITDPTNRTSEWGNYVRIDGYDGRRYYYCHLSRRLAEVGQRVAAGDVIGIEGSTGRSTGSHLHFEVRTESGLTVDPTEILGIPAIEGATVKVETQEERSGDMEEEKHATSNETQATSDPHDWAKEAVEWAVENGIIYGTGDGDLALREPCTREQMMVFLHRFAQMIGRA